MHPSHEINKTYHVTVSGYSESAFKRLQNTVTRIKNNTMQRETLEHILTRGSQYLLDKVSEMPLPRKTDK